MKKMLTILVALVAATLICNTAQASTGALCSDKEASSEMSRVDVIIDQWSARAIVIAFLADSEGRPVCGAKLDITTSRNQPESGWETNADDIVALSGDVSDLEGKSAFMLTTNEPAGTTVILTVGDTTVKEVPFSYSQY